ncbi:hypothetical protein CKA32_004430 [Geitlerinema sp. FC II]|nr:hypothetical protein CKA32_004430 [Geitlerinema sp. FC II]
MTSNTPSAPKSSNRVLRFLRKIPGVRQLIDASIDTYRAEEILHDPSYNPNCQDEKER